MANQEVTNRAAQDEVATSPFFRLPPELRLQVYRQVIEDIPNYYYQATGRMNTLAPPAIARVNKTIRNEFLPLYYPKVTAFDLNLVYELDGEYDERAPPVDQYLNLEMFFAMKIYPGYDLIREIKISYAGPHQYDQSNFIINLVMTEAMGNDNRYRGARIGDENLEWKDADKLHSKIYSVMKSRGISRAEVNEYNVPLAEMSWLVCQIADYCPRAAKYLFFSFDFGH